ncbi:hypothetical protein [Pseudochelatococcus contaminans]|uniref:Secreted protein n=1 Tax=Pseudochelatococcus contaminans TaxID=1538103 RepID=A0A7W6EFT0_9HYPH|nr:hypothetical protein [Pseudochelatococcus contaminans]MBB3809013.1 hypothetical protein [Pseudochelatococcus contaminans]
MKQSAIRRATMGAVAAALLSSIPLFGAMPVAHAQEGVCARITTFLEDRKALVTRINKMGKRPDPRNACTLFRNLVSNGNAAIKWLETNKDWCQIPDQFISGLKADNAKADEIRGQACRAATQQAAMEKRARENAQNRPQMLGGSDGDPVTGRIPIPQGAL